MPAAIRTVNLTKSYKSGTSDLVILRPEPGNRGRRETRTGGGVGAGKSTLLHLLGGLDTPTRGEINYGQDDICKFSGEELAEFRNKKLGYVWQMHSLLAEFTAVENVMMPLLIRGESGNGSGASIKQIALDRLDEVGLRNRADHRAGELSGGEQQRVVLAQSPSREPQRSFSRRTHR